VTDDFQVIAQNADAPFTLRAHRGEGMVLLAMNWSGPEPPVNFVGFAIEYREPNDDQWWPLTNRIRFADADEHDKKLRSSLFSPFQKFRWVHFPLHAELPGAFTYRVKPVFMDEEEVLSYGEVQQLDVELRRETYPNELNVTFTRGFVSSQAFVDHYVKDGPISTLLPRSADDGLDFVPTHPDAADAYHWMGFEARDAILEVLDEAVDGSDAHVFVIAYDLNEPEILSRLQSLGHRLRIIIDDSDDHGAATSAETKAEELLALSAGDANVKRQHMGSLQHNKTIVVASSTQQRVVCGSTNFSWRGFFVQNNNAVVLTGTRAVDHFRAAFEQYWASDSVSAFGASASQQRTDLELLNVDADVAFSPHSQDGALRDSIAQDILQTTSSLFYSLAFLYQTEGSIRDAVTTITEDSTKFVFGMSDRPIGGIELQTPDANLAPVNPAALGANAPEPFSSEPAGGSGIRLHHKFVVIDFDQPEARVYLGSYNFSEPADTSNGENLLLIRDRRIAVAYMVEAVRIFDHYQFRIKQQDAENTGDRLVLMKPPTQSGEEPWWKKDYTEPVRIRDRLLFS